MHDEMTITLKVSLVIFLLLSTQFLLCRCISAIGNSFTKMGTSCFSYDERCLVHSVELSLRVFPLSVLDIHLGDMFERKFL